MPLTLKGRIFCLPVHLPTIEEIEKCAHLYHTGESAWDPKCERTAFGLMERDAVLEEFFK